MGSMSDDVECKYIGEEIIIGLNAKYLQESLSIVDDLFAVVGVVDPDSPIVVMSETDFDAKNFGTLSVIMPMMI
jgi:DNA polymerase III sliding clamp (beta) subunit (PCNA family)